MSTLAQIIKKKNVTKKQLVDFIKTLPYDILEYDDKDNIVVSWGIEDVIYSAADLGYTLNKKQAREILNKTLDQHDCNIGISWETINCWIEDFAYDNKLERAEVSEDEDDEDFDPSNP